MKNLKHLFILLFCIIISCNMQTSNMHDGSYAMNISMFGTNLNSKADIILKGDKIKMNDEIYDCKQYSDKIIVGNGNVILNVVDGDLIVNISVGKVRYVRISNENTF